MEIRSKTMEDIYRKDAYYCAGDPEFDNHFGAKKYPDNYCVKKSGKFNQFILESILLAKCVRSKRDMPSHTALQRRSCADAPTLFEHYVVCAEH